MVGAFKHIIDKQEMSSGHTDCYPGTKGCCILCDNSPFFPSLLPLWFGDLVAGWQAATALQEMDVCYCVWGGHYLNVSFSHYINYGCSSLPGAAPDPLGLEKEHSTT